MKIIIFLLSAEKNEPEYTCSDDHDSHHHTTLERHFLVSVLARFQESSVAPRSEIPSSSPVVEEKDLENHCLMAWSPSLPRSWFFNRFRKWKVCIMTV
jgi:hypothetical protein